MKMRYEEGVVVEPWRVRPRGRDASPQSPRREMAERLPSAAEGAGASVRSLSAPIFTEVRVRNTLLAL